METTNTDIFQIYLHTLNATQKNGKLIKQCVDNNNIVILFDNWEHFTDSQIDIIFQLEQDLQNANLIKSITIFNNDNDNIVILVFTL